MGLFDLDTSTARWVHGRLIYVPRAPQPRWARIAAGLVPVYLLLLFALDQFEAPGSVAAALVLGCAIAWFTWHRRGRRPAGPSEPLDVDDALVARVRRLLETGRVGDAMLAVETELTVPLTDAKVVVDAVQRRIDHERGRASASR